MQVYSRTMSACRVTVDYQNVCRVCCRPLNVYRTVELFSLYQTVVRQFESAQLFSSYKKVCWNEVGLSECVEECSRAD